MSTPRRASYPLASLLELRARERDDAVQALGATLDVQARAEAAFVIAERGHDDARRALAEYPPLRDGAVNAAELQQRAQHRERLRSQREESLERLRQAQQHVTIAQEGVEQARADLATARAAHRAVELHHAQHAAGVRAAAQGREDAALDEASQARLHRRR